MITVITIKIIHDREFREEKIFNSKEHALAYATNNRMHSNYLYENNTLIASIGSNQRK